MRVLYIVHSFDNRAGTEEHTKLLSRSVYGLLFSKNSSSKDDCGILYPDRGSLHLYTELNRQTVSFPAESTSFPVTNYGSQKVEAALLKALDTFQPDLIHVQHFFNWPLSVLDIAINYGVPAVISFHDYYTITPFFTMQGARTAADALNPDYVRSIFGTDISSALSERKDYIASRLARFHERLLPSKHLQRVIGDAFSLSSTVIPHGIAPLRAPVTRYRGDNFKFGVVGGLLPQKGWRTVIEPFLELRSEYPGISLTFYGGGEELPKRVPEGITFRGRYTSDELPAILSEFTVGVIPSIFAETFCLVLSELWQGGIPVCASRIGALAERIQDRENGILFEPGNPESIYDALRFFLTDDQWRGWVAPAVRGHLDMATEYLRIYQTLISSGK